MVSKCVRQSGWMSTRRSKWWARQTTSRLDGGDPQGQPMTTIQNKGGRTWKWFKQDFRGSQQLSSGGRLHTHGTMPPDVLRANRCFSSQTVGSTASSTTVMGTADTAVEHAQHRIPVSALGGSGAGAEQ
jgi:hypothetical protein